MYKVMIVDDEILAIEHLKRQLVWEEYGYTVMQEATSAKLAIEKAAQTAPDLVFLDIRMPVMDGLELSRKLMIAHPGLIIVLVTSHRDFDYAKEAFDIGVMHYLLKHELKPAKLVNVLQKISAELSGRQEQMQAIMRQAFREWLEVGEIHRVLLQLDSEVAMTDGQLVFMYVREDRPASIMARKMTKPRAFANVKLSSLKGGSDLSLTLVESLYLGEGSWALLFKSARSRSEMEMHRRTREAALLVQQLFRRSNCTATIVIQQIGKSIELYEKYREIALTSPIWSLAGQEGILFFPDYQLLKALQLDSQQMMDVIKNGMEKLERETVKREIRDAFDRMSASSIRPTSFYELVNELLRLLDEMRAKEELPTFTQLLEQNKLDQSHWYDIKGIGEWFCEQFDQMIVFAMSRRNYSKKVEEAIRYIRRHHADELTLAIVGEALSISGEHLRHLFKEETGQSFLEYLTEYRIAKAKKLLQAGDMKMYEIASSVGYKSSQYFSTVFKKWTGVTPQEFGKGMYSDANEN